MRWRSKHADMRLQHYRYWVIWRCPTVRFLDYQKVRQTEREKAQEVFGTAEEPTELATKVWAPIYLLSIDPCID